MAQELVTTSFDFSRANVAEDATLLVSTFVLLFVIDAAFKRAGWFPKDANGRYLVSSDEAYTIFIEILPSISSTIRRCTSSSTPT